VPRPIRGTVGDRMEEPGQEAETQTLRIDRVMRSHEITDDGLAVISFQVTGVLFRVEMTLDHAADLVDGLAQSVERLRAWQL
jgi:hypothetical protein